MSRKGENIYKRKDGRWEGRYMKHVPGQKPRYGYVYAPTYREARAKLQEAAAQWKANPIVIEEEPLRFDAMAVRWEQHIAPQIKESSFVKYHTTLAKHLLPRLGSIPLKEMTYVRIEDFSRELLETLAPRTVSDILCVLRSILRFAQRSGEEVPCDGSAVRIRRNPVEIRVLTRSEQNTLCSYLLEDLNLCDAGILLTLYTGLRVGEICALRWEDISMDDRLLHVRRTMQRIQNLEPIGPRTRIIETSPKSATSARTIPLPEDLVRVLQSLPGRHEGYFLTGNSESFVEPRQMQYYFSRTIEDCGLEKANYHALRHTFATRCVEIGFDVKSLSELLGHSTVTMTMDRYVHPTLELKRTHMQRLADQMSTGFKTDWMEDNF